MLQLSEEVDSPGDAARSVESGRQPSTIIDLAGWLILSQIYQEQSRQAPDSTTSREFDLNARKCLDEALRFFDASQDTPPPEAFFSQESLERFRDRPEPFSRWRIINLRATLPKKM